MKAEKTAPREQGAAVIGYKIKRLTYTSFGDGVIPTGSGLRFQTAEEKATHKEAIRKMRQRFMSY